MKVKFVSVIGLAAALMPSSVQALPSLQSLIQKPNLSISVETPHLIGGIHEKLYGSLTVHNRSPCGVRLARDGSGGIPIAVDCPQSSLDANSTMRCEISVEFRRPGTVRRTYTKSAEVDNACKQAALDKLEASAESEVAPLERQLEQLRSMKPGAPFDVAIAELELQYQANEKKLEVAEAEAEVTATSILATVDQTYDEVFQQHEQLLASQKEALWHLQNDKTAEMALEAKVEAKKQTLQQELQKQQEATRSVCDPAVIKALHDKKATDLEELRSGAWHSKCGRTASQILAEAGETIAVHLGRVGGQMVPATPTQIANKAAEWDAKIAAAAQKCTAAQSALQRKTTDCYERMQQQIALLEQWRQKHQTDVHDAQQAVAKLQAAKEQITQRYRSAFDAALTKGKLLKQTASDNRLQAKAEYEQRRKRLEKDKAGAIATHAKAVLDLDERVTHLQTELMTLRNGIHNAHLERGRARALLRATGKPTGKP